MIIQRNKEREFFLAIGALTLATGSAFAPDAFIPMLARAFLLQWAAGFAVVALIGLITKRWWLMLSSALSVLLITLQVREPGVSTVALEDGASLRIAHMNLLQPNIEHEQAIEKALKINADLISFQEIGPEWAVALNTGLAGPYPYRHIEPRTNCYGIALFSKIPFNEVRTLHVLGSPFIEAVLAVDDELVRVLAIHTTSPISYSHFRKRTTQLIAVAERVANSTLPTFVVGDLNTVHWDGAYARFCVGAQLSPTLLTQQRTWPSIGPLALIPLDHLLVTKGVSATSVNTFELPGSDHRGLLADLKIARHAK